MCIAKADERSCLLHTVGTYAAVIPNCVYLRFQLYFIFLLFYLLFESVQCHVRTVQVPTYCTLGPLVTACNVT